MDGKRYYSNEGGYCLQSAQTPDGYSTGAQGTWTKSGVIQIQEQNQNSSAIEQTDNVVVTVPGGFIFHSSDERGTYMTSVDGSSLICIMSESLTDFGGYTELVYTYQEEVLGTAVKAELGVPQPKTASHLASDFWYCYRYMDASSLGIPGFLEVCTRTSGDRVQMAAFDGAISPLDTDGIMDSLAFLWRAILTEGRNCYVMQMYTCFCRRVIWTRQDEVL